MGFVTIAPFLWKMGLREQHYFPKSLLNSENIPNFAADINIKSLNDGRNTGRN
jgi:hypothetical protein